MTGVELWSIHAHTPQIHYRVHFTLGVKVSRRRIFRIHGRGQRGGYARWPRGARRQADAGVNGVRLGERSQVKSEDMKGKVVIVDFYATLVWALYGGHPAQQ